MATPVSSSNQTAITQTPTIPAPQSAGRIFDEFVKSIKTGDKKKVAGIYVENKLALRVIYQPPNDATFVSSSIGVATYFLLPYTLAKNHGFLAHNFLSGALFFDLQPGDTVQVIWGDVTVVAFASEEGSSACSSGGLENLQLQANGTLSLKFTSTSAQGVTLSSSGILNK